MNGVQGIVVFGANGSGKTTLGRALSRILGYKHMDIEDYYFKKSPVPYTDVRPREEYISMMLCDIEKYGAFVLSAVTGDFGEAISKHYKLAVHIKAPHDLRMDRVRQRAYDQHGDRILEGGDMYKQEMRFFDFVAARPLGEIDDWAKTLTCPIICVDGTEDWRVNAARIAQMV